MKRLPTMRQLCAFNLLAVTAPALMLLCGLDWYCVLTGGSLSALVLFGLWMLRRRCGGSGLADMTLFGWGKRTGAVLLAVQIALAVLLLNAVVSGVAGAFPDVQTKPFTPLVLLAVCSWSCGQGKDAVLRACGVLFLFLCVLLACVFLFALPDAHPSRLLLPGQNNHPEALAVLLLPCYGLFLIEEETEKRIPGGWLCLSALVPTVASALCAAVPGSRGSFYQMAKSVELLSVAQRIEPLVSMAFVIGFFGAVCLLGLSVGQMCAALGGNANRSSAAACLAAIPGALAPLPIPSAVYAAALAVAALLAAVSLLRCRKRSIDKNLAL